MRLEQAPMLLETLLRGRCINVTWADALFMSFGVAALSVGLSLLFILVYMLLCDVKGRLFPVHREIDYTRHGMPVHAKQKWNMFNQRWDNVELHHITRESSNEPKEKAK